MQHTMASEYICPLHPALCLRILQGSRCRVAALTMRQVKHVTSREAGVTLVVASVHELCIYRGL